MTRKEWSSKELATLKTLKNSGLSDYEIARKLNRSYESVNSKITKMKLAGELQKSEIPESNYPIQNKQLKSEGDAVILTDLEAPFQHSEFVNRVLDLADTWGIQTLHLGGDFLHYDRLSAWGDEWQGENEAVQKMMDWILCNVPTKKSQEAVNLLETIKADGGDLSDEMKDARAVFRNLNSFKRILVALGNHDDRFMRALGVGMKPIELLVQIEVSRDKRWEIAPYYHTEIETEKGKFRIEHPRSAGRLAAIDLAVQNRCHTIIGHPHRWAVNLDPSGSYWAIQTGHCVDEERLAYVMQRSAKRDAHALGATIIRGGYPFVLHRDTPFEMMKRM